ncbi:MAG: hypothetical protein KA784_00120 [Aquabacterium sp.]|nr:hypothetical protein [Aquabacterium sp.]
MPIFNVMRKSDGAQVYTYQADAPIEWAGFEFATHDHVLGVEQAPAPVAPTPPVKITCLAFRNRFTQAEKVAIEIASLDIPAAAMQQRAMAAALRSSQKDVDAAEYIDLSRADTRAGVLTLEQAGLIAAGRALAILDTPPTTTEVFHG